MLITVIISKTPEKFLIKKMPNDGGVLKTTIFGIGYLIAKMRGLSTLLAVTENYFIFSRNNGYRNLTGIDISPDQVALTRQVTTDVIQGNVLEHLEQNPNSYDLIISFDLIEHFHKDEVLRFLDGCHTALKPNGRLILQTPNADSPWGSTIRYGDFTHEVCFNSNVLCRLLKLVGFQQTKAREAGPVPWGYSAVSTVRYLIWQLIRCGLSLWNLVETGSKGDGVFTRVFLVSGIKGG